MHAARCSQPGPGATGASSIQVSSKKPDRLDLLARVITLRNDGVERALSANASVEPECWDDLFDQAELLGKQWAAADPVDARKLLPSMLTGLRDITERFERGYNHVPLGSFEDEHVRRSAAADARKLCNGICGHCDTDVIYLLDDIAAEEALLACPCCGESW